MKRSVLFDALSASLLAGEASIADAHSRLVHTLGRNWRWAHPLAARYPKLFGRHTRPHHARLLRFLPMTAGFAKHGRSIGTKSGLNIG
jgi:hypothetical protein